MGKKGGKRVLWFLHNGRLKKKNNSRYWTLKYKWGGGSLKFNFQYFLYSSEKIIKIKLMGNILFKTPLILRS